MRKIIRYSNRKLYDTSRKSYITFSDILEFLENALIFSVVDHETGEDITDWVIIKALGTGNIDLKKVNQNIFSSLKPKRIVHENNKTSNQNQVITFRLAELLSESRITLDEAVKMMTLMVNESNQNDIDILLDTWLNTQGTWILSKSFAEGKFITKSDLDKLHLDLLNLADSVSKYH